ncbi:hypothetical protein BLNAU_1515 [Blattamonas nauphoetae]|uniref:RPGR-interacting protein 1 first C2 domain-containing protein n=1 Tax=Blattamonas nauphoetae TaxID=2049346 RepID=A0ABQ9YI84_9EUKA|nr:hypothetical protein BLNAU_1515 [Blattamonas nauphoetae]
MDPSQTFSPEYAAQLYTDLQETMYKYSRSLKDIEKLQKQIDSLMDELNALREENERKKKDYEVQGKKLRDLELELGKSRISRMSTPHHPEVDISPLQDELEALKAQVSSLTKRNEELKKSLNEESKQVETAQNEQNRLEDECSELKRKLEAENLRRARVEKRMNEWDSAFPSPLSASDIQALAQVFIRLSEYGEDNTQLLEESFVIGNRPQEEELKEHFISSPFNQLVTSSIQSTSLTQQLSELESELAKVKAERDKFKSQAKKYKAKSKTNHEDQLNEEIRRREETELTMGRKNQSLIDRLRNHQFFVDPKHPRCIDSALSSQENVILITVGSLSGLESSLSSAIHSFFVMVDFDIFESVNTAPLQHSDTYSLVFNCPLTFTVAVDQSFIHRLALHPATVELYGIPYDNTRRQSTGFPVLLGSGTFMLRNLLFDRADNDVMIAHEVVVDLQSENERSQNVALNLSLSFESYLPIEACLSADEWKLVEMGWNGKVNTLSLERRIDELKEKVQELKRAGNKKERKKEKKKLKKLEAKMAKIETISPFDKCDQCGSDSFVDGLLIEMESSESESGSESNSS